MTSSFRQPLEGTRTEPGTYVKGQFVPGATSILNFDASVQPATGDQLETLPEGLRESGMYRLYTDFALRTVNEKTKEPADKVTLFDKQYKVVFLEPWQNGVIPHYKAFVSEIG